MKITTEQIAKLYGDEMEYIACDKCPINEKGQEAIDKYCNEDYCDGMETAYESIKKYFADIPDSENHDNISHPQHYTQSGLECIEEMILVFGIQAVKHFCLCNVWKYRKRALYKNGEEDMKKSDAYLKCYKSLVENNKAEF